MVVILKANKSFKYIKIILFKLSFKRAMTLNTVINFS